MYILQKCYSCYTKYVIYYVYIHDTCKNTWYIFVGIFRIVIKQKTIHFQHKNNEYILYIFPVRYHIPNVSRNLYCILVQCCTL